MSNDIEKSKKIAEFLASVALNDKKELGEAEFNEWLESNSSAGEIMSGLSDEEVFSHRYARFRAVDKRAGADKMLKKINAKQRRKIFTNVSSCAAAILTISFLIWNYVFINDNVSENQQIAKVDDNVKLILADGRVVDINGDMNSIKSDNVLIHKTGAKEVTFDDENIDSQDDSVVIHKIVVPNRTDFTLKLADGTKVVLNAGSEIEFPNKFNGNSREVRLKGEGYFEVTKNSDKPFVVHTNTTSVRVYGTKFNVNNYSENITETFLLEGSVGVTVKNGDEYILKPNQLIETNNVDGKGVVRDVDNVGRYVGWITGYFIFQADELHKVIDELSRWYDVKLAIGEGTALSIPVTGSFKRDTDLSEIIKSLEIVSGVKLTKKEKIKMAE